MKKQPTKPGAPKAVSPKLRESYAEQLIVELQAIEDLETELKDETKERREEIKAHKVAVFRLRRLLSGHEEDQTEIPGTEVPNLRSREARDATKRLAKAVSQFDEVTAKIGTTEFHLGGKADE